MIAGRLVNGDDVQITSFDGERIAIDSPRAMAPGAPFRVEIPLDPPIAVEVKTFGSKRDASGRFDIRGRAVALRRDDRERLLAAMSDR